MRKIILASTSPKRKELLEEAGLVFEVVPSDYEEDMTLTMTPDELTKFLSLGKARAVKEKFPDAIIISADTVAFLNGKVIGKPHTPEAAYDTLRSLSGKIHDVWTGFTIWDTKNEKIVSKNVLTKVHFKDITDESIWDYIQNGCPLKYAGAYTLDDISGTFVEKVEGSRSNVIGLPVEEVLATLKDNFEIN